MSKYQNKINAEKSQKQIRVDNAREKSPAEKPLKIKGSFDTAMKKIARTPKSKK